MLLYLAAAVAYSTKPHRPGPPRRVVTTHATPAARPPPADPYDSGAAVVRQRGAASVARPSPGATTPSVSVCARSVPGPDDRVCAQSPRDSVCVRAPVVTVTAFAVPPSRVGVRGDVRLARVVVRPAARPPRQPVTRSRRLFSGVADDAESVFHVASTARRRSVRPRLTRRRPRRRGSVSPRRGGVVTRTATVYGDGEAGSEIALAT